MRPHQGLSGRTLEKGVRPGIDRSAEEIVFRGVAYVQPYGLIELFQFDKIRLKKDAVLLGRDDGKGLLHQLSYRANRRQAKHCPLWRGAPWKNHATDTRPFRGERQQLAVVQTPV